ncbi:MAG: 4,5-DOPA dioxygenase extradiol [Gammaproteobacteria bacterium]|nr:4,5-DOPA dioxygenase extradiol [Gammaproteobacteria bacterium]
MTPDKSRIPAVFFGHGSPMNTLEQNRYTEVWRRIGESALKPKVILAISAHWTTRGTAVTAMDRPRTIHDFGGFPRELFEVQYPASGDPKLAARVRELLAPVEVTLDNSWGLDHGTWSVLAHACPRADVPVVQLSIDGTKPPRFHYELAQKLAPLRDEGVLIVGSGNVVHNLGRIRWTNDAKPYDWALRFNDEVRGFLLARDHERLIDFAALGEDARLSVPTPDHYLPLLYVIAQQSENETISLPVDGIEYGSIGMLTAVVGLPAG